MKRNINFTITVSGIILLLVYSCKAKKTNPIAFVKEEGIQVNTPISYTAPALTDSSKQLVIGIKKNGSITFRYARTAQIRIAAPVQENLQNEIRKVIGGIPHFTEDSLQVYLEVNNKVPFKYTQEVVDVFRKENIYKFKLISKTGKE